MRVKIFVGKMPELEKKINSWLSRNEFEIFKIVQSESDGEVGFATTISIFYRKAE